jgi:hypothetical protein
MQRAQAHPRNLELFATKSWVPHVSNGALRIVSGGRAAVDVAHALGYGAGGFADEPDATLVLTLGAADAPARIDKRRLVVDLDASDAVETAREWLAHVAPRVLNIVGPRRSRQAGAYGRAYAFLSRVLAKSRAS